MSDIRDYVRGYRASPADTPESAGVLETLGAAFERETTVGSLLNSRRVRRPFPSSEAIEEGFDPLEDLEPKYRPHANRFTGVRDQESLENLKLQLDDEIHNADILDRAGFWGEFGATAAVQLFDPVNYIGGVAVRGPTLASRMLQGARAGAIGTALQEPVLQGTQETRTLAEGALNLGASAFMGGIIGAGIHFLSPAAKKAIAESNLNDTTALRPVDDIEVDEDFLRSVGAAEVPQATPEDLEITSKGQRGALKVTPGFLGPTATLVKSGLPETRQLGFELFENQFQVAGSDSGTVRQSAETAIKVTAGRYEILKERALLKGFRGFIDETGGPSRLRPLARYRAQRDYSERLSDALRNGDVDPNSPAITEAAQFVREKVLDPIGIDAFGEKLPTKTALSYLTRAWNRTALEARQGEFLRTVEDWFAQGIRAQGIRNVDLAQYKLSAAETDLQHATQRTGNETGRAEIDRARQELASLNREFARFGKRPLQARVKALGGVDPAGAAAAELRAMGVTPRNSPGLFRQGGLRDVDNLEYDPADWGVLQQEGAYISRQDLLDALADEARGAPRFTPAQADLSEQIAKIEEFVSQNEGAAVGPGAKEISALEAEVEKLRAEAASNSDDLANLTEDETAFYANQAARSVWETLTGNDGGLENPIVAVMQGPLKGRTLLIPDERVKQFLNNDAFEVLGQYIRTMSAEIELKNRFGRADMRDQIQTVQDKYTDLASNAGSEKEAMRLNKARRREVKAIEAGRDILRGTYLAKENGSGTASVARSVMAYNFVSKLGDLVLSAIPDVMRVAQVHGLQTLIGPQGISAFSKSVKALSSDTALRNYLRDEVELAGIAEVLTNARVQGMTDLYDPYAGAGPVETWTRAMANAGANFAGANIWNQHWKQVAFQMGINRFHRMTGQGWDKLKPRDRKYLRTLKVSEQDFRRIGESLQSVGEKTGPLVDPKTAEWTDARAAEIFRNALRADADSVIVTPGAGDKPLFARHPLGAIPLQFQSFFLAAHNRALIRGLGEDHRDFMTGSAMMVAMGMSVFYLKSLSGNFDIPDFEDAPGTWLAEGIDRSGVVPLAMQINNAVEPFAGAGVFTGLSAAFGGEGETASRYRFRRQNFVLDSIMGATGGTVKDALRITGDVVRGETGEGTVGAAARLLPFANHPGVKQFLRYYAIPEAKDAAS